MIQEWLDLRRDQAEDRVVEALAEHGELPEFVLRQTTGLRAARLRRALTDLGEREVILNSGREVAWTDGTPIPFYVLARP